MLTQNIDKTLQIKYVPSISVTLGKAYNVYPGK